MTCKVRVTAEELNYILIKQTSGGNITRFICGIRASQFGEMRGILVLCVAILAACENTEDPERSSSHIDHQEPQTEFIRSTKSAWRIPEQYLVVLKEGARDSHVQRTMHSLRAQAARSGHTVHIMHTYSGALCGFLIKMTSEVLPLALKLPHVAYIEEDSSIFAQGIPWNLERIIQTKHESGKYTPPNDGARVSVFLLDTSVRMNHREIEGKVMVTDFDSVPEEDGVRVHRQASQCDSHGTHIAGVLSGRDSGVARGVSVNIVRVLNCQGRGSVSGALAGLEYIHASLQVQPVSPVIILLPFVGGFSRTLNTACQEMVQSGAVLIAAAGNYQDDACMYSPASEPEVITVGATNAADQPLNSGTTGTNLGRCVDLFAPGDDIISSSSDCPTCFTSKSGTSQAAAHVAGIAAVLLNAYPGTSPAEVLQLLRYHSVQHVFNPASLPSEHHLTNPDMVAALPTSATTGEKLLCRSVWSKRSGVGSSDTAAARCRRDEEMFSCSSYSINGVHARERIELQDGQKVCEAHHGTGEEGVYAVARCCTGSSVKCQATASVHVGMDAECPNREYQLTGCSSHYIRAPDVAEPSWSLYSNRKACPAGEGGTSHAYCCHAPNLECHLIEHHQAEPIKQVEVSCEDSWTLTGCNAIPHGSVTHGAYMRGNTCVIQLFGGDKAATAITICCRYRLLDQQSSKTHEQNT